MMALLLSLVAMLPFIHDIISVKGEGIKEWLPDFGIEETLTYKNEDGKTKVHGFSSYRTFIYFLLLHLFAAIGWAGWAKDAKPGQPYKFFLLVPAILAIYTVLVILFDARDSNYNEANTKIFIIIAVNFLLMFWFLYRYFRQKN
ncbi:hypothetical protein NBT05_00035 [Aquimarina sp. ERC-38]|uniref:hypothetical protein n=1 Tax=Aquimarina sp. ERC-38 TaxID=2949996 RepID=UPI00224764A6|nr:hypothetical protein [Aquimarina sp. ERC-38]UZO80891.1 hypothetical protein NBT05_00035 [Aquimarina sp. ERC-38]